MCGAERNCLDVYLMMQAEILFPAKESALNWDGVEGSRKQFKGKFTDDHIDRVAGKRDQLAGKIHETYGIGKDEAEKQIKYFEGRNKHYRP